MKRSTRSHTATVSIEAVRIVRDVRQFNVAASTSHNPTTIGNRIDAFIHDMLRDGDELQSITIDLSDPAMQDVIKRTHGGSFDLATDDEILPI